MDLGISRWVMTYLTSSDHTDCPNWGLTWFPQLLRTNTIYNRLNIHATFCVLYDAIWRANFHYFKEGAYLPTYLLHGAETATVLLLTRLETVSGNTGVCLITSSNFITFKVYRWRHKIVCFHILLSIPHQAPVRTLSSKCQTTFSLWITVLSSLLVCHMGVSPSLLAEFWTLYSRSSEGEEELFPSQSQVYF